MNGVKTKHPDSWLNLTSISLILFFILFSFPLMLISPSNSGTHPSMFNLFKLETISALCLMLFFLSLAAEIVVIKKYNYCFLFSASLLFIIPLYHFLTNQAYSFSDLCFSLFWISCPLTVFIFADIIKKWLTAYLSLFWTINIFIVFFRGGTIIGLSGNQNWHAAFLLATTPFVVYSSYLFLCRLGLNKAAILLLSAIPALIGVYILSKCDSRGAWLALAIMAIFLFKLCCPALKNIPWLRIFIYGLIILTLLVFLFGDKLANIIFIDVRPSLWFGAAKLTLAHPFIGVGAPEFESSYAPFRGINYFLRSGYYAVRSSHPHNQILYISCCFGILGAIAWFYLWIWPVFVGCYKFLSFKLTTKICFISYIMLLVHSMFDLIFSVWPTVFFSGLFLGILWKECNMITSGNDEKINTETPCSYKFKTFNKTFFLALSASLLIYIIADICINIIFSTHIRKSWTDLSSGRTYASLPSAEKAFKHRKDPIEIYHSGIIAWNTFDDHLLAIHYFDMLKDTPCPVIAHSNAYIAAYAIKLGRYCEALDYINKESINFPISIVNLYNKLLVENKLGLRQEAETTKKKLYISLKYKGLTESDIPEILKNTYYDAKFNEFELKKAGSQL